jgi:hypothetical protein
MPKLRLNVEELTVASFETVVEPAERGTVHGHIPTNVWCQVNSYRSYCPDSLCTCPPPVD